MMVLTKALIKESEENAVKSGAFSFCELMKIAGETAAEKIAALTEIKDKKIAVVCGNGNNGGDGFVVANRLAGLGGRVSVIMPLGNPLTENASFYFDAMSGVKISDSLEEDYDIIIDAVFGIGLNREVDKDVAEIFAEINSSDALKIAIDIPSGVEADTGKVLGCAIMCDYTITFIALKPCFVLPEGSDYCGKVIVADIGVKPVDFSYLTIEKPQFPKRKHNSHKGTFGTALLFCGSYGMAGAAILATRAALASGVGIAKCVVCDGIYDILTCAVPEAVCLPVGQDENGTYKSDTIDYEKAFNKVNAVLIGCGMAQSDNTKKVLEAVIKKSDVPLIIDADGINLLAGSIDILRECKAPVIITPHPAEMARLCQCSVSEIEQNRVYYAKKFATDYNCTVVLKGADTIVATTKGEIFFNLTGNPGMATGGSGDVLSGIMVSLLAQGFNAESAAKAAVYLHGEAGDKAALKKGERAMLPSDIIEEL